MSLFLHNYSNFKAERDRARIRAELLAQKLFERLRADFFGLRSNQEGEEVVVPAGHHPQNVECKDQRCWFSLQVIPRSQLQWDPMYREPSLHLSFSVKVEIAGDWSLRVMTSTREGSEELCQLAHNKDVEANVPRIYTAVAQVIEEDLRNFLASGKEQGRLLNLHPGSVTASLWAGVQNDSSW